MELFRNVNIDWMGKMKFYLAFTVIALTIGIGSIVARGGLPVGIDFRGGTIVYVRFTEAVTPDHIRSAVEKAGIKEARIQQFDKTAEHKFIIATEQKQLSESALDSSKQQIISEIGRA